MRQLRCPKYGLLPALVHQVHQTSITVGDFYRQTNQFLKHFLQREIGTDDVADFMQQLNLTLAFHDLHAYPPYLLLRVQAPGSAAVQLKVSMCGISTPRGTSLQTSYRMLAIVSGRAAA